jgi:Flp pilus assembly protein TadG
MRPQEKHRTAAFKAMKSCKLFARRLATRHLIAEETGATVVEFALTSSLLLMVIFGILDGSRALYFDHYVCYSAEEASRYAMVRGSTWKNATCTTISTESCTATSANVQSLVQANTPMGNSSDLTVTTSWTGKTAAGATCNAKSINNSPGCVVQVQVTYSFNFVLPFLPRNTLPLTSTSAVAITQ